MNEIVDNFPKESKSEKPAAAIMPWVGTPQSGLRIRYTQVNSARKIGRESNPGMREWGGGGGKGNLFMYYIHIVNGRSL